MPVWCHTKSWSDQTQLKYSPIWTTCAICTICSDLEMVKHKCDLLIGCRHKEVRAVGFTGVVGGITWWIKVPFLSTSTPISEIAGAIRCSSARNTVLWHKVNTVLLCAFTLWERFGNVWQKYQLLNFMYPISDNSRLQYELRRKIWKPK